MRADNLGVPSGVVMFVKAALVGSVLALASLAAPNATSAAPDRAAPNPPAANPAAMSGHGELAVIHDHQLFLIGGPVSGVHYVGFGNQPSDPQWSYDGKWLAVTVTPPPPKRNPYADEPSKVFLVSPSGKVVRQATTNETPTYDVSVAWSPTADRLAFSYQHRAKVPAGDDDVFGIVNAATGESDGIIVAPQISGFAWSPDGSHLAVGRSRFTGSPGAWQSKIVEVDAATDARRAVTTESGSVLEVAGWWPDGSGVLAWLDYQGSASLAADGLPLLEVSIANGHRRQLAKWMLQYPQWLATSKVTNQVAFIAGGDRVLTSNHKHVEVCGLASCRAVAQPAREVSFDPAWSATGQLAFVRDRAIVPKNGVVGMSYVNQVQASGGIRVRSTAGSINTAPAGAAASAPTWGSDGSLLVVRRDALWLLAPDLTNATRIVGGLQVSRDADYYGFVPWHDSFAWTDAVS